MSPRAKRWSIGLAISALVATIAVLASFLLEWTERTIEGDYRGEAALNPLLAAERTLTELGLPTTSAPSLGALPPDDAVLILRDSGRFMSPRDIERLLAWCASGGNLVLLFPGDSDLLDQIEDDLEQSRFEMPLAKAFDVACVLDSASEGVQTIDLGAGELELDLPSRFAFEDELGKADLTIGDPLLARLLSFEHGLGRATLVADDRWASNRQLGERDHARLLWELCNVEGERTGAVIVFGEEPPGLFALIWKHGWTVVLSGALLTALILWRAGARFGPRLPELSHDRRDFSEHVTASGEFLWRHGASAALLAAPQMELRRRIAVARPDWSSLGVRELAERLAEHCALDVDTIGRVLQTTQTQDAAQFVAVVRDLETLRKAL